MWWPPDSDVVATTSLSGGHHILSGGHKIKKYFMQWYQRGSVESTRVRKLKLKMQLDIVK